MTQECDRYFATLMFSSWTSRPCFPEADWSRRVARRHMVQRAGVADLPVYVRVTQADGHQAWSSPIYLIA
jgi:hypothetical protein